MRAPGIVAWLALGALACRGARTVAPPSFDAGASPAAEAQPPEMRVTELARAVERFQGIALDGDYVYFGAMFHGSRRVPKKGGPIEVVAPSGNPAPSGQPDPGHAYFGGYDEVEAHVTAEGFSVGASGVYRRRASPEGTGGAGRGEENVQLARSLKADYPARKVLVTDERSVYWIEPAADAVLSVPKEGGAVRYVFEADSPIMSDLALVGDRIYLLDIGGALRSALRSGSDLTYHGDLSDKLGANRNALWMAPEGRTLYIVSDALGYSGPTPVITLGEPLPSNLPPPAFESRVVALEAPEGGLHVPPHDAGLFFAYWIAATDLDAGSGGPFERELARLSPFRPELANGEVPIVLSLGGQASSPEIDAALTRLEAMLRERLGPGLHIERQVAGGSGDAGVAKGVTVGLARSAAAVLFAVPAAPSAAPSAARAPPGSPPGRAK